MKNNYQLPITTHDCHCMTQLVNHLFDNWIIYASEGIPESDRAQTVYEKNRLLELIEDARNKHDTQDVRHKTQEARQKPRR